MYDSSSVTYSSSSSTSDPAVLIPIFIALGIFSVILYVVFAFFLGKIFKKAGVEAWKAWVPIYNQWTFLELGGQKGWLALFLLFAAIPFLNLVTLVTTVFSIIAALKIGKAFGKDDVFVALYILLTPVWIIWLAVDKKAVWQAPQPGLSRPQAPQPPQTTSNGTSS